MKRKKIGDGAGGGREDVAGEPRGVVEMKKSALR